MQGLRAILKEHRHFIVVVTVLTLVMTYPTIVYVFRTDVFWLPTGNSYDVYIKIWDIWYVEQVLTSQADRYYTDLMFYPEGLSLTYHPFFIPHAVVANLLHTLLPLSNTFSLAHLLIVWSTALTAYVYIRWLLDDKWTALFGAVVFGLSQHVVGHPNHPDIAFLAPLPLALYCFQRGINEKRLPLVCAGGLVTGLTTVTSLYLFVCLVITLLLVTGALALTKWRDKRFWLLVGAMILVAAVSSLWRVYPLMRDAQALDSALIWYGEREPFSDLMSLLIAEAHPVLGRAARSAFQTPADAAIRDRTFLGYLPLVLVGAGMCRRSTRRFTLMWAILGAVFCILLLGSSLHVNGIAFSFIALPKFYLDRALPALFRSFFETENFHMGVLLPFAVLACYGIIAVVAWRPRIPKRRFVLICIVVVAFEYYIPVQENLIPREQFDYLDWLANEEAGDEIRLINLPMGRKSAKRYNLYQALSGFPHAEGAISRTPDGAFEYIRANPLLDTWRRNRPMACSVETRATYLPALDQLEADGFSHVVFHQNVGNPLTVVDSFRDAQPSYRDEYVWIYRLNDLRESCQG